MATRTPWIDTQRMHEWQAQVAQGAICLESLQSRAQELQQNKIRMFSREAIDFQHPDRWHRDAILDRQAPRDQYFGKIPYLDVETVGDSKHVWEPNRWGWVYPLGALYQVTRDSQCFDLFRDWVFDWYRHNRYPFGINYCSALEQVFRGYAARWSLELFQEPLAAPEQAELLDALLEIIWTGCYHVQHQLSWYFAPNTHLMGEGFWLYVAGLSMPGFREATGWRQLGRRILAECLDRQFHADGTHRELSTGYHHYSTDFYLHALWVTERYQQVDPPLEEAARRFSQRLAELATPTGQLPPVNDCDGGRLTWFADRTLDASSTLQWAHQRWPHPVRGPGPCQQLGEAHWMPWAKTVAAADAPTRHRNDLPEHHDSGIVTYKNESGDYVLFRAGPFGYHDCPHSHDGALGVVVHLAGQPFVVDCGTGAYTQGMSVRNEFRSAVGKNTLLVNGQGPSEPAGAFEWQRKTEALLTAVSATGYGWMASGRHVGFAAGHQYLISIARQIQVFDVGIVAIVDHWQAEHEIDVTIPWSLAPSLQHTAVGWKSPDGMPLHLGMQVYHPPSLDRCDEVATSPSENRAEPGDRADAAVCVGTGPFSRDYGWLEQTHVVRCTIPRSRRGYCLTLLSRIGRPVALEQPGIFEVHDPMARYTLMWQPTHDPWVQLSMEPSVQAD